MDLVKIGFLIQTEGLAKANKEVDALLTKVDQLGKKPVAVGDSKKTTAQYQAVSSAAERMIEKQKTLSQLLPYMDKQTANLASGFWLVSKEANAFNGFLDLIAKNKALDLKRKEEEALAKTIANTGKVQEAARQKEMQARQNEYQKSMSLAEKARQENMQAVQKQYQAEMDAAAKASANKAALEEAARVKRFKAEQDQYQKDMAAAKKAADAQEALRQRTMQARQNEYQRTQAAVKAAADKEIAATKALNDQWSQSVSLQQAIAKYQKQGLSYGNATKMAKMEISGADVTMLQQYQKALNGVADSTNRASESQVAGIVKYALLSAAIYGAMTATLAFVTATVKMADEYTSIQNRMKLYIDDAGELAKVNANLAQYSMANNVGLRETATLFARLQPAMQKIGANTAAVTSVVDAFGKSMRIGGATAAEAASATLQFSQAMASGKLAGDEFRSISEASPRFLKAIADGSGIAASRLKEMSSAGMLTTEVISKALLKEYPKLIEENKRLGATLEQGANAITTAFTVMVGEFNEGAGITKAVGTAMLGLGQSMFKAGQSAKETGAAISKWFGDNATIIGYVVDAVELLAITWASRYVASVGLSIAATLRQNAALVTSNGLMQTLGVTALRTGVALQTAFAFFGGWVGILTTLATVAATYLLLRDNTAQATGKIVEQSKYVDMSAESFKKLNAEQQKNVQASLGEDIAKANEQLDKQANTVNRVLLSYAQFAQMQGKALNSDVTDVINQTVKGLMDYDTAYRKLLALGVPKNVLEDFKKQKDVYDETASSSLKLEAAAKAAGMGIKLGGNEAQNAQPSVRGLASAVDDLGDASVRAANKFKDLVTAYSSEVVSLQKQTALMASSGLDAQLAGRVIKESNNLAERNEKIANGTTALENYKTAVSKLGAEEQKQHQANIKALEEKVKKGKENLAAFYAKGLTPSAQALQAAQDAQSKLVEARNKAERDANKKQKETRTKKTDENYLPEQIEQQLRLLELLEAGNSLEVARTASTKEYVKWFGSSLEMAKHFADVNEAVEKASNRANATKQLKEQKDDYADIVKFMAQGYSYAVAQRAVQADFTTDANGIAYANNLVSASLRNQLATKLDEVKVQQDLQDFMKSGLSVEEAQAKVAIYRNQHLTQGLITLSAQTAEAIRMAQWESNRTAMLEERNGLQKEALYLTEAEDNELASIMQQYDGITLAEAKSLKAQKDIVKTLTAHNEQLKKNKTLTGALETVNFDAFGDFGNPFQSALEGLNDLLFGMKEVDDNYAEMYKRIDEQQALVVKGSAEYNNLTKQRADLEDSYYDNKKKAEEKAVDSSLTMAKSLFSENSKGYKLMSTLEQAYQAKKIAFALWEKKDEIALLALKLKAHVTDALGFTTGAAAKLAAQSAVNVAKGTEAVLSQGSGDPYTAFGRMAAMAAVVAGLGIAIGSIGGGGSGTAPTSNQGTGTVFGGAVDDKSQSIVKAMETLAENSDLGLPISSAMLASLRNIENSLAGVANLIIRGDVATELAGSVNTNASLGKVFDTLVKADSKITSALFLGLDKMLGIDVGGLVGDLLGSVIGGLFGKKSSSVTAQGLAGSSQSLGSILEDGVNLREYADIKTTKKSWFSSSTSYSTKYGDADQGIKDQFNLIFANMYNGIMSASEILGKDLNGVSDKLKSYIVNIGKIDIKGLSGSEIQEKLEAVFGAEADKVAQFAVSGLSDFQQIGEGYFETLVRVAAGVESAKYYTDLLNVNLTDYNNIINKQGDVAAELVRQSILTAEGSKRVVNGFYDLVENFDGTAEELYSFVNTLRDLQDAIVATGKNGDYLTSTMILAAGGADNLSDGLESYFDMLSAQEQVTELTRRMAAEFGTLGQKLPSDIEAYKALVASIDISSEAGQKLYGAIIALAPEFTDLQDAIEKAQSEADSAAQAIKDQADEAAKLAEEAAKAAADLAALVKEAQGYTTALRIQAVSYDKVTNKAGNAATEILRASMLAYLGSAKVSGGFYDLVTAFDGSASELYNFIVKMRDVQEAIFVTGQSYKNITQAMLDGAGGIDGLASGLSSFFDFLTPAEKANELTRRMKNDFAALGLTMPTTVDGFKALVQGIDTSTKAGQDLFGRLIALSGEFATLQEALQAVQDANDEAAQALAEAAQAAADAAKALADLGVAYYITGQKLSTLTQVMADAAGGTDALGAGLSAMYDMLSPTEQAAELTRRLTEQFAELGLALPSTTQDFLALVKGFDATSAEGQALLGQVIALAPEFNDLQSALESATSEVDSLVQSLLDLAGTANQALGETNQVQNLTALRSQFESTSLLAQQGDVDAAERLLELGQSLLDVSKNYSVSSSDYAKDVAMIQAAAQGAADAQSSGLGYSSTATLNTSTSSGTTATVTTDSSSTDAKIDKLREDMITAIYAVAKYTQNTADRLERWDYGDRMNVRVEQDPTDAPIKVDVV